MNLLEWHEKALTKGTSGDMVFDILRDWEKDIKDNFNNMIENEKMKKALNDIYDAMSSIAFYILEELEKNE